MTQIIPLSTPHMSGLEKQFVDEAFATNWISYLGPNVVAFENEIAHYVGVNKAAATSSGTAALHLALRVLEVKENDIVFCSSLTFVASANPILYQKAKPVFIDSDPATWNMSPVALQKAFDQALQDNRLPKAVIVVNLYGQSADLDPILDICNRYNVPIIEDAAESLGATYKGKASGSLGKIGIFSFNGNKIITSSSGGMLVSDDETLINKARYLSTQAKTPALHYEHNDMGYNYRMSNILAGIGRGQLRVIDARIKARQAIFQRYQQRLKDIPAIEWMPQASYGIATCWLSAITINPLKTTKTAAQLLATLIDQGIESRPVWKPMHLQPLYQYYPYYQHQSNISVSDQLFHQGICLPSGSNLSEADQDKVVQAIRLFFR